jgi:hypothetical protein
MAATDTIIYPFELAKITDHKDKHPVVVIIGPRNTGKTTLLKWLLYQNGHRWAHPFCVSRTADANSTFVNNIPNVVTFKNYDPDIVREFMSQQETYKYYYDKGKEPYVNMNFDGVMIMDDILADLDWTKDEGIRDMIYNGRHYNITVIITLQDPMAIPRKFRGQIDYIFCFGAETDDERDRLYKYYWNSRYGNKNLFNDIFDRTTVNYCSLVIDNFNKKTKELKNRIFFCKTPPPESLPSFTIGSDRLWSLHNQLYCSNWFERKTTLDKHVNQEEAKKKRGRKSSKIMLGQPSMNQRH